MCRPHALVILCCTTVALVAAADLAGGNTGGMPIVVKNPTKSNGTVADNAFRSTVLHLKSGNATTTAPTPAPVSTRTQTPRTPSPAQGNSTATVAGVLAHNDKRQRQLAAFSIVEWTLIFLVALLVLVLASTWLAYYLWRTPRLSHKWPRWFGVLLLVFTILLLGFGLLPAAALIALCVLIILISVIIYLARSHEEPLLYDGDNSTSPFQLVRRQKRIVVGVTIAIALTLIVFCAVYVLLPLYQLRVWDRETQSPVVERAPRRQTAALAMLYGVPAFARFFRLDHLLKLTSQWAGADYNRTLADDADKRRAINDPFVRAYGVDMSPYERPDYRNYSSVNDWFSRRVRADARPIASGGVIAAADSRVTAITAMDPSQTVLRVKQETLVAKDLLGSEYAGGNDDFKNGAAVVHRLAPQDYHRVHAAVGGVVQQVYQVDGSPLSVNEMALRSSSNLLRNERVVVVVRTSSGKSMATVAVGATLVGSIVRKVNAGDTITRGQDLLYFQFGGSTVVQMFPDGMVRLDDDLVSNSDAGVETFVKMGTRIATEL
ncbi:phosphatidylserine decarboxylase [Plasmodiophora brassicae]